MIAHGRVGRAALVGILLSLALAGAGSQAAVASSNAGHLLWTGIATPERDALTTSEVHRAVTYQPITRYDVPGGYLNLPALSAQDLNPNPAMKETS